MGKQRKKKNPDSDCTADYERQIYRLKSRIHDLSKSNRSLNHKLDESEETLGHILNIGRYRAIPKIKPRRRRPREAVAIIMASDWHVGETVDSKTIESLNPDHSNEYTPEIAKKRAKRFWQNALRLIEKERYSSNIDEAVVWLGGDFITGYIHPELIEVNQLGPMGEILLARDLIRRGIEFLLNNSDLKKITIPCNYGNHGRITQKMHFSTATRTSLEWVLYHILADDFIDEKRVQFQISDGAMTYIEIFDYTVRFHHGDNFRYQGGLGGLGSSLNTAIFKLNKHTAADYTVIGHWHQLTDTGNCLVNGSLIGYSAYSLRIGAAFEPPRQCFWLLDRERGKTAVSPIWVDDR